MPDIIKELFKKEQNRNRELYAVQTGMLIPIEEFPDAVIREKMLGDGIGIRPTDGRVYAPTDGEIVTITPTLHAFCLKTPEEVEILVHIGIDTVELNGTGFTYRVKQGSKVKKGELICEVDLELLAERQIACETAILFINMERVEQLSGYGGEVKGGVSEMLNYILKEK